MGVLAHLLFFGPFLEGFWPTWTRSLFYSFEGSHCYLLVAHLLFVGPFWRTWTICWSILAQQGEPLAWEPRFCARVALAHFWRTPQAAHRLYWRDSGSYPKSPIAYIRATLAHTPSRPSPILGRFWRTCCFLTSMQTRSTILCRPARVCRHVFVDHPRGLSYKSGQNNRTLFQRRGRKLLHY